MKVLITGSSSGIGFLTGIVLAERGHDVYMTTHTLEEEKVLKEKIKYLDLDVSVFKLDICNKNDREKINSLDIDVLFLHAGVGSVGLLKDIDISLIKESFEVNVFSNLELIQKFLKKSNQNKKIVVTSSLFANHACPYFGSYILSKSSLELMTNILKRECSFTDDKFILIKPGAYHTGFNQYLINTGENNKVNSDILSFMKKIFLFVEEKDISSIVLEIVYAIEKGTCFKYSKPFLQRVLLDS